jgi:hypothetical protein
MLDLVDVLLRDVFLAGVPGRVGGIPGFVVPEQVRFQPPDGVLRTDVVNLNRRALCVYLADLRENRKLRSNERIPSLDTNGDVVTNPAPSRVDCHYLITAWTPTQLAPGVEPTVEEHQLLYQALGLLLLAGPLNPGLTYPAASAKLTAWPRVFRQDDLPTAVLPVDGFGKLSEFWSTMGANSPWRPAIYLVVTVPVALLREIMGPMVTTTITETREIDRPESGVVWMQIGGHVWNTAVLQPDGTPTPQVGAWVQIEEPAAGGRVVQRTTTAALGRFTFVGLAPGQYRLRAGVVGLGELDRLVDVPSETGEYDFRYP